MSVEELISLLQQQPTEARVVLAPLVRTTEVTSVYLTSDGEVELS